MNDLIPQSKNLDLESIRREVDLAWLAGILDGEGCLELTMKDASNKNGKKYLMPKIRLYNTDIRMVKKASEIYQEHNLVFFYTLGNNGKQLSKLTGKKWKTQIGVCIASQGTTKKLLELVEDYLVNKRKLARYMIDMIDYVQKCPKYGNAKSFDYTGTDTFRLLWNGYMEEKHYYIDPSSTTRTANESLVI